MKGSQTSQWSGRDGDDNRDAPARIMKTTTSTERSSLPRSAMISSSLADSASALPSHSPSISPTTTARPSSTTLQTISLEPPATAASSLPYDLNISNGTCYYAPGQPMDPGFIPCGNAASDTKACCWTGDVCLGDQACFGVHQGVYTTYMGGCTDGTDTLSNGKCPQKPDPYASEPWIGLAYCNGTSDEWIACPQEASPSVIKGAGPCVCPAVTQQRIVAFRDASVLPSYASLPTAVGGAIKWLGGYTPTVGTTGDAGSAQTSLSSAGGAAGKSRVSLIVGLSVSMSGVVLLALVGVFAFYRRRALKEKEERGLFQSNGGDNINGGAANGSVNNAEASGRLKEADAPQATSTVIAELEVRPARPWSMRSELDGGCPVGIPSPSVNAHRDGGETEGEGPVQSVSRMSSGRASYGPISPMTTGPSLAEALEMEMAGQMTGSSAVSTQTPLHTGQTDSRRHPSMHSMHSMRSTHSTNDRRPPFETLVELE